jgi:plastocyanin
MKGGTCPMVSKKGIVALALAGTMVFGGAFSAMAAKSPTGGTTVPNGTHKDAASHTKNKVVVKVKNGKGTVTKVTGTDNSKAAKNVMLSYVAKGKNKAPITKVAANVFNNKTGKKITAVMLKTYKGATMTVNAKAFNKSKAKKIYLVAKKGKIVLNKNAFKGKTGDKVKFVVTAKSKANITFKKGAFTGIGKKSTMTVKGMTKKNFKAFKKAVQKAGFKGKITRK